MASYPNFLFTASTTYVQVDPAGDLQLLVQYGEQQITFQVSIKAMSLASPVWRTMLDPDGPFKESQPSHGQVTFHDDDAEALLILLLAAHLRLRDVPQTLWYEQLMNVFILCDKYDCVELVRPWISAWNANSHSLFISWVTGDEATFKRLAQNIVKHSHLNGEGRASPPHPVPPGMADAVHEARLQAITSLVKLCHLLVHRWGPNGVALHNVSAQAEWGAELAKKCNVLMSDSLMEQLKGENMGFNMWPRPPSEFASKWPKSVNHLAQAMRGWRCNTYPSQYNHRDCGFVKELNDGIDDILANIPSGMDDSHRNHLATQRSKLSQSHAMVGLLGRPRQPPPPKEDS